MAWTYNSTGVQTEPQYKLPPVGDYDCQIIACEEKLSQRGQQMLQLTVKIIHGEYHNEIKEYIVNNQHAMQTVFYILNSCGCPPVENQPITPALFIGKRGNIRVKHEPYDGDMYPKIQRWNFPKKTEAPAVSASTPAVDPDKIPF